MSPSNIDVPTPGDGDDCRVVREILDRVADKWSLYIFVMLKDGPVRFNELRRRINGISQRMLTITLRALERDGLVKRTLYPTIPPRVDYELTEAGRTLLSPVMGLVTWANANQETSKHARVRYDADQGVLACQPSSRPETDGKFVVVFVRMTEPRCA